MRTCIRVPIVALAGAILLLSPLLAPASSHREAPFITQMPKVDGTDFYMFNSYETGREGFVTIVANYQPLQDPYGGPNYFTMDPNALYEILIDNTGDAVEDITFQFRFTNTLKDISLNIGSASQPVSVAVPLVNVGPISASDTSNLNVTETYTLTLVRGNRRTGQATTITNADTGSDTFIKPVDNIGQKTIPDYETYARAHIYNITLPGTDVQGKLFVGQRKDPFVVNLGEIFDLVNIPNPLGPVDAEGDDLADKNVTSLILEIPAAFLVGENGPTIGGWTTASLRQARVLDSQPSFQRPAVEGGAYVQVSRLGMPLVNEAVIGLKDKNRFNASQPRDDAQFAVYVTNPTFPAILESLFGSAGVVAPTLFPRTDLVAVFLTGVADLNQFGPAAEMLRLNTSIPAKPAASQNNLGVIGGDNAGFPNGRRPGDDVVDVALRVLMGVLLPLADAPSGQLPFTDGALVNSSMFNQVFPYIVMPIPGSPQSARPSSPGTPQTQPAIPVPQTQSAASVR